MCFVVSIQKYRDAFQMKSKKLKAVFLLLISCTAPSCVGSTIVSPKVIDGIQSPSSWLSSYLEATRGSDTKNIVRLCIELRNSKILNISYLEHINRCLDNTEPIVRYEAAKVVIKYGCRAKSSIPFIDMRIAVEEVQKIRQLLFEALGAIGIESLPVLNKHFEQGDAITRRMSIDSMTMINPIPIHVLSRALDDEDLLVINHAILGIGKLRSIDRSIIIKLLDTFKYNPSLHEEISRAIVMAGAGIVGELQKLILETNDSRLIELLLNILVRIGPIGVSKISMMLSDNECTLDNILKRNHVGIGRDETKILITMYIMNNISRHEFRRVFGIGVCDKTAKDMLIMLIGNDTQSEDKIVDILWAIGNIGIAGKEAIPKLIEIAISRSDNALIESRRAIANIFPGGAQLIINGYNAANLGVKKAIKDVIDETGTQDLKTLMKSKKYRHAIDLLDKYIEIIIEIGPKFIPKYLSWVLEDKKIRMLNVEKRLHLLGDVSPLGLIICLKSRDEDLRKEAIGLFQIEYLFDANRESKWLKKAIEMLNLMIESGALEEDDKIRSQKWIDILNSK